MDIDSYDVNRIDIEVKDDIIIDYVAGEYVIDRVYDSEEIKQFVRDTYDPEDVFDEDELENWAINNGFIKE